ncbi:MULTISPECIES: DUF6415 family natural product biosynthesis protein [unclassified Streptomyces]|uniref:DUF6415 family natural product biosynthesis protein n=1 Tax=unclassified Streptomyces TaxID=2593676 RepID=UPI0037AE9E43
MTVVEAALPAAHPLSVRVPEKHVPLRTPEFYEEVVARLRLWKPLPVGMILETLHQVLESPAPPPDRELVHVHWKLRSWHQRLSTIATADRRFPPPADILRLIHAGRAIGDEPIGDGTQSLGQVRRLASTLSDLLDEIARTQGLRVEDEDDEGQT